MKKIIAVIFALIMILCLAACGADDTNTETRATKPQSSQSEDKTPGTTAPASTAPSTPASEPEISEDTQPTVPPTEPENPVPTTPVETQPVVPEDPDTPTPHTHSYTGRVTTNATCTAAGVKTYTCSGCTSSYTEAIPQLNHNYVDTVTAPTCTAKGYTTRTCTGCSYSAKIAETNATGHAWNSGSITKQPTCKDTGVKTYTCTVCSGTKTETIAKTTTHSWNSGSVTKQPTCKDTGVKTYTCTVCSGTKTETIAKTTTHSFGSWTKVDNSNHKRTCSVCSKVETASHSWNSGSITKQATCTATGTKTYTCTVCRGTKTETIAALGHNYKTTQVASTCTVPGYTKHTCTRCSDTYKDNYLPCAKHTLSRNEGVTVVQFKCSKCDFDYALNYNTVYGITPPSTAYWTEDGRLIVSLTLINTYTDKRTLDISSIYFVNKNGQKITVTFDPDITWTSTYGQYITYTLIRADVLNYGSDISRIGFEWTARDF